MRLFIALEIPEEIRESLVKKTKKITTKGVGVRWVSPDLWHITLRFLGEIPEETVPQVTKAMAEATEGIKCFPWRLRGLGGFPNLRRPRVLMAGVDQGSQEMKHLAARIEEALQTIGFPSEEERPFAPHLTLGRAAGSKGGQKHGKPAPVAGRVLDAFYQETLTSFGEGLAERIVLMESQLDKSGSTYRVVAFQALLSE